MQRTNALDEPRGRRLGPALTDSQGAVDGPSYGNTTFNKTITDPELPQHARSVQMRLDPLPQIANQDPETMEVAEPGGWSPKVFEQMVVRDNVAGTLGKHSKLPILGRRQLKRIFIDTYGASVEIYGERADREAGLPGGLPQIVLYRAAGAHQEIIHVKGLHKVIVGTKPQEVHPVCDLRSP